MKRTIKKVIRRLGVGGTAAVAAVAVLGTAAVAALLIFISGSFSANAGTVAPLTVDSTTLTGTLIPGATVGIRFAIHNNDNDFAVHVKEVLVKDTPALAGTPSPACDGKVSLVGGSHVATYGPGNDAGTLFVLPTEVVIPAHGGNWVQVDGIIHQDASGTVICGVTFQLVASGEAGA